MGEPRKTRGAVENIRYRYKSATRAGYTDQSVNVRQNRTLAETNRQIERIKQMYPDAFVENSNKAYSTALRTFDALGLTGRLSERHSNARLLSRRVYPRKNR